MATGTVTLHFSGNVSAKTSYNAYDWEATSVNAASNQVLGSDVYRASASGTVDTKNTILNGMPVDTGQAQKFNMFETDIDLTSLQTSDGTLASKDTLMSVTFDVATNSSTTGDINTTGIFAISAGTGDVLPEPGSDFLMLFGLLGTVAATPGWRAVARRRSVAGR